MNNEWNKNAKYSDIDIVNLNEMYLAQGNQFYIFPTRIRVFVTLHRPESTYKVNATHRKSFIFD